MQKETNSKNKPAESFETEASEREIDETLDESFPLKRSAVLDFRRESRKRIFQAKIQKRKLNGWIDRRWKVKELKKIHRRK